MKPPIARKEPHPHTLHGDVRQDDYYWLRGAEKPEVIEYLEAENQYYDEVMKPLGPLTDTLYQEMVARVPADEAGVAVQDGPYYYYSRMEGAKQYPIYARKRAHDRQALESAAEEVLLDLNALATGSDFLSVTVLRTSADHQKLAYLENRDGTDRYTLLVRNIATGELLPDQVPGVFLHASLEWDKTGEYLYYTKVDETQRPYQLWRHQLGNTADVLLYEENDVTFSIGIGKSRSGQYLWLKSDNKETDEAYFIDLNNPEAGLHLFDARRPGIKYDVEHWNDRFLILTNQGAKNFRLMECPVSDMAARVDLIPYDETRYLQAVYPFREALVIAGRQDGLTQIWTYRDGNLQKLSWDESIYTVDVWTNRSYDTEEALITYESFLTPEHTLGLNLRSGALQFLKAKTVPGSYDPALYHQERLWATASDGTKIPLSVVYKQGALDQGPAPLILYGYGSYGMSMDPTFSGTRLPLLDRGIVYVVAHVRGGAEMGYTWYENGKFLAKKNTFTDFVDAARDLIHRGYTAPDRLAAQGRSAGGLLMGAIVNLAPELFQVVVPGVPFVDVINTMSDATIPLTSLEWDEWGNPADPTFYAYMKSYSPYDNVEAKAYPHMLVLTGLNDPRVAYWEPAKWVARLRVTKTDSHTLLFKTHMGAGHGGSSGRYNRLKETAAEYAFILDKIGMHQ